MLSYRYTHTNHFYSYAEAAKSGAHSEEGDAVPIQNNHVSEAKSEKAAEKVEEVKDESRNFIQKIFARIGNGLQVIKSELSDPKLASHVAVNVAIATGVIGVLAQQHKKNGLPLWPHTIGYGIGATVVGLVEFVSIKRLLDKKNSGN